MAGNTIGKLFTVTTFGESHGPAIGAIVDGCPSQLALTEQDIQVELNRRRPGQSRYTSQRRETDEVRILSGVFEGKTTGTPIALLIDNVDQRSRDYEKIKDKFRPGHADYTYQKKYGFRDYRGGGRSSARETAMRVAAGAIAKRYLRESYGITIRGWLSKIGLLDIEAVHLDEINNNCFFCPQPERIKDIENYIEQLRRKGDSVGAQLHIQASGMVGGWGEPVFDRLDADIAHAMMSINAVKGVAIGAGFDSVRHTGSEHRDELTATGFTSNRAGGILGGISNGEDIEIDIAFKPTSSIRIAARTIDKEGNACDIVTTGRHDPCVGIRAVPIAEAMLAIVLMDHCLRQRGQNFDVIV